MSISVEFPNTKPREPSQGSAGLRTHIGGACTTVSALMEASKAILCEEKHCQGTGKNET